MLKIYLENVGSIFNNNIKLEMFCFDDDSNFLCYIFMLI